MFGHLGLLITCAEEQDQQTAYGKREAAKDIRLRLLGPQVVRFTPWCLVGNGGMDIGDYYWGLYRYYYRDPFPHSLPSIREFKDLRIRDCLFSLFVRFRSSGQPRKGKTLIRNSKTRSHSYKKHIYKKNSNNSTKSEKTIIGTSLLLLVSNHDYNKCYN